jgi:hypothetical protein
MSYATVANLREYLPQIASGTAKDGELQRVLDRANAIVNDALGMSFAAFGAAATERDLAMRLPGVYLRPPAYQAGSIVTVSAVYARGTSDEDTEEIDDWLAEETVRPYRIYRHYGWHERWYRIEAIWGYGPAPTTVVEVELEAAVNIWRSRDAASFGNAIGVEGMGGVSVNRALTWAQRDILDGVRRQYLGIVHG